MPAPAEAGPGIGTVTLQPNGKTGTITWPSRGHDLCREKGHKRDPLGRAAGIRGDVGPGDFVYFAPYVPHHELNPDESETVDFVVVRSDNEKIVRCPRRQARRTAGKGL